MTLLTFFRYFEGHGIAHNPEPYKEIFGQSSGPLSVINEASARNSTRTETSKFPILQPAIQLLEINSDPVQNSGNPGNFLTMPLNAAYLPEI